MRLNSWLTKNNIKHIISVDDDYSKTEPGDEEIEFNLRKGIRENDSNYLKLFFMLEQGDKVIEAYSSEPEMLIQLLVRMYNENKENKDFINGLKLLVLGSNDTYTYIKRLEETLESIKSDNNSVAEVKKYGSYNDAKNESKAYFEGLGLSEKEKVLWLIDYELSTDTKQNGLTLIDSIRAANAADSSFAERNIFIILSGVVIDQAQLSNFDFRIHKIDKSTLSTRDKFELNIIVGSKQYLSSVLVSDLSNRVKDSYVKAQTELLNQSQHILDYLIISYPNKEGTHPIDLLLRLFGIIGKENFEESIVKDYDKIIRLLSEYEYLVTPDDQVKDNIFYTLMHKEKYNENVNSLCSNISSGDIFKINEENYVLLSQACDISVRAEGDRVLEYGLLAKLKRGECPSSKSGFNLEHLGEECKHIDFRDYIQVNFGLLDLCTINRDGTAKLKLDVIKDDYSDVFNITDPEAEYGRIEKYFDKISGLGQIAGYINRPNKIKLFKVFKRIYSAFNFMKEIENENPGIVVKVRSIIKDSSEFSGYYNYNIISRELFYDIKREGRLNSVDTLEVINEFGNYSCRISKPGDFSKDTLRSTVKKKLQIEDITNAENHFSIEIQIDNDKGIIKEYIKRLNIINKNCIEELDIDSDTIIIKKNMQLAYIEEVPFPFRNNKLMITREDLEKTAVGKGLILTINEIASSMEEVQGPLNKIFNRETKTIKDTLDFIIGETTIGDYVIVLRSTYNSEHVRNDAVIGLVRVSE
jgi:hypothetical protein